MVRTVTGTQAAIGSWSARSKIAVRLIRRGDAAPDAAGRTSMATHAADIEVLAGALQSAVAEDLA